MGLKSLGLEKKPKSLTKKQALAAVGQGKLMSLYDTLFHQLDINIAQILVTRENLSERGQYIKLQSTLRELFAYDVLPVINENDSISTSELRSINGKFGDNDSLSAIIAGTIQADFLFLLTDVDGVYSDNPKLAREGYPVKKYRRVDDIPALRSEINVDSTGSNLGTGGMATKLIAAEWATAAGCNTVILNSASDIPDVVEALQINPTDDPLFGTLFVAKPRMLDRKWWILHGLAKAGTIKVDAGAVRALKARSSLFSAGIVEVVGNFFAQQAVGIVAELDGKEVEIARGIVNYNSQEISRIKGCQSSEIEGRLGYMEEDYVIGRENLVLIHTVDSDGHENGLLKQMSNTKLSESTSSLDE
jgi:glutamate 5-kinase